MPPDVCTARSAVVSKCGGTAPHFDKLKIRQGWRILSRARDRSGIIAAYPAQLLERIARFPPEAGMRPNLESLPHIG